jgi:hypothetical protein
VAFQVLTIREHLKLLPSLGDDGMAEQHEVLAIELSAAIATAKAESLGAEGVMGIESRLLTLSEAIGRRFFLQGSETIRAPGMTLA